METEFDLQRTGKIALSYDSSKSCKSPLHFKLVRVSYLNDHYASKLYQCSICLCLGVVSGNANAEKKNLHAGSSAGGNSSHVMILKD